MPARLFAVSGLGPKEPAAFVVEAEGCRLLLDCGEGPEPGRRPDFAAIGRVDGVILSHSHNDHVGSLRFRDKIGSPPVFATAPVLSRLKDVEGQPIPIQGEAEILGTKIQTGVDGHAPGGVWLRLDLGEGLLYMGDHSPESRLYAFDMPPPTATMIIDGSYGDAELRQDAQRQALAGLAARGPVLFPVPPDGRGPDIAIFLQQAGFDVAIDDQLRSVAVMLTQSARASARPEIMSALERLISDSRRLDGDAAPRGVMLAHGGTGDVGVSAALINRWQDEREPRIVITGHAAIGTAAHRLLDCGRASFQRWNVHPTLSDNVALIEKVNPKRVIPAFGDPRFLPAWREKLRQCEVISMPTLPL